MHIFFTFLAKPFRLLVVLSVMICHVTYAQQGQGDEQYKAKLVQFQHLLQSGQMGEGIAMLDDLIDQYPQYPEAYYAKSLLYAQAGNFEEAVALAEEVVRLSPSDFTYNNHLINLYKSTNNVEAVIPVLEGLLKYYPDNKLIIKEKILLQHAMGKSDEALQSYTDAVAKVGESDTLDVVKADVLNDLGQYAEVQKLLERWYNNKSELKEVYSNLAMAYGKLGNSKKALLIIDEGLKMTGDEMLYFDIADIHSLSKNEPATFTALKRAFDSKGIDFADKYRVMSHIANGATILTSSHKQELANALVFQYPRIPDSYNLKADVLWQSGQPEEARSLYLTSLGMNPRQEETWRKLLNVEIATNALDDAILHGQEALSIFPGHVVLGYFTGVAYFIKGDTENARNFLEGALNNSSQENDFVKSMIYGSLGDLYHKLDMINVSDAAYEEAIRLDSANVSALNNLAYYLSLRKENLDKAAEYARLANELEPGSGTFQDTYAWVLFQQGNYKEALIWIEKAVKSSSPSAVVLEHYGDILVKSGKTRDAVKQWERALNLSAGDQSVNIERLKQKIREKKYIE